jgi:uncharacterized repeat protein (TIGR02059 family)
MSQYFKTSITFLFFIELILIGQSCKKEELSTLSTSTINNITATSASCGGNITSDGGASVIERGVCWSLNADPTTSDSKTVDGNGTGQFTSNITGLIAGSSYHARAYATNAAGTAYGADLSFATSGKAPECLTLAATNITSSGTTLNGIVNANYLSTTVIFEYGTTISYGQTVTPVQNLVTGNAFTNVSADIYGLIPGTIYHFRVKTMNSFGIVFGNDLTITTAFNPLYVSSTIGNATPNILEMTYDLTLANIVPVVTAFTVMVNFVSRSVNTVIISGTKVLLTLSSPVIYGDVVTVAYTKPATNPIQTSSGGQAATINAQTVINSVIPATPPAIPVYLSSAIENAAPTILEITYNMTLSSIVPSASSFSVRVNSVTRAVNSVTISGTKVLLTLSSPVVYGDVVTVAYSKPASNPLQTFAGGQAATISTQTVVNNVSPTIPPYVTCVSSSIQNATPDILEMTYNLSLAAIVPAVSAFTVSVNSVARSINMVSISGTKVLLTLASPVVFGDAVTVSYIKPATNPLQTSSGGQPATMSAQTVSNKVFSVGPIYVSFVVENLTPNILEINYNEILGNTIPSPSAFIVMVNGIHRTITSVAISGNKVLLTLADPVVYGDIITVSYIKPASNQLITATGETAGSFSSPQRVTNNLIKR